MKTLYNRVWYRPMEIAEQRLIQNSRGARSTISGNYNFVLELIKQGSLRAKNYAKASSKTAYWLVPEDEIIRYHINKVDRGQNVINRHKETKQETQA